jgi:carbamoyl-phosphate synthase/aspartate carbamoyltransferase
LGENDRSQEKSEYSLTQHLANNLIDMYINLPSKNHYRRPASYTSKGYHTRRMAIDYAVPLITNVKNAKMLAEALVRKLPLEVATIDSKSSYDTYSFPGLVNISAFVPNLAVANSKDLAQVTEASIAAGFTTAIVLPVGSGNMISDRRTLEQAQLNISNAAYCNYALGITATAVNAQTLDEEIYSQTKALFVPGNMPLSTVAPHFASWPAEKAIITNAKGSDLASILLLASLHNRSVHVTDVQTNDDLLLITLSKAKQLKVTCDVSVYSLFYSKEDFPSTTALPTSVDQKALWQHLDKIDALSVGTVPSQLAADAGEAFLATSGFEEALPLLLTAVTEGRLTVKDIRTRLHDNPVHIFNVPEQTNTHVEVVIGRKAPFKTRKGSWSPLGSKSVTGSIHRVVVHNQTVFVDGALLCSPTGHDISAAVVSHALPKETVTEPLLAVPVAPTPAHQSFSGQLQRHQAPQTGQISTSLVPHPSFHRRNILSVKQFTHRDLYDLFSLAHEMRLQVERNGVLDILKGKVLCNAFYEPSTRTSCSFEAAMKRCGGEVVSIVADKSSVVKGESLPDTIRTLACYADAIVIRHPDVGSAQLAAKFSPVPVINAGDGIGEHPTQALLDVYTIRSELGTVNGRTITLLGDLKNGRTVHSLVTLLCLYSVRLNFVAPPSLAMPQSVVSAARKAGVHVTVCESLEEVLADTDVLYVTRVQKERFENEQEWTHIKDAYRVDHAVLSRAKEDMIVMHPLPRVNGMFFAHIRMIDRD